MPEQSPSLVAKVLAAAAAELGDLGATAAGAGDLAPRLQLARGLVEWASAGLTADTERAVELGRRVEEFTSAGPGVSERPGLATALEELLDTRGAGRERVEAAAESDASEPAELAPSAEMVTDYLRRRNPGSADEAQSVRTIHGGFSKRTFLLDCILDGVRTEVVIRQVPAGRRSRSLEPEFDVVRRVREAGIPAPEPLWIEPDANTLGGAFFVTRRAAGENFGDVWGAAGVSKDICVEIALLYAALHRIDVDVDGLSAPVSPRTNSDELRDMLAWQERTLAKRGLVLEPVLAALFAWLRENIPAAPPSASLVHGDAAFSNFLIEDGRVTAILDWELAHLGDSTEELAYLRPSIEPILPWQDFLDHYERAGGRRPDPAALRFFDVWSYVQRHIGCLWLSQNFDATGRYASAVAAYVHGPRFLRQAVRAAFGTPG